MSLINCSANYPKSFDSKTMHFFRKSLLILFLMPGLWPVCYGQQPGSAKKGWLHLEHLNTDRNTADLSGEWEFYWKQLLDTGKNLPAFPDTFIQFPKLWNGFVLNNQPLTAQGFATYRLRIVLNKDQQKEPALLIPDFYTSYKLFVNKKLVASDGKVGQTKETSTPHWSTKLAALGRLTDTAEIILQVCNFTHSKGGSSKSIQFGSYPLLSRQFQNEQAQDIFLSGCLFMGAIFFFCLFFFSRNEKSILFFALFCLMYSYRVAGSDIYVLHSVFPSLNYFLTLRLEYLTLCFGIAFFVFYVRSLYPKEGKNLISWVLICISIGYGLMSAILPPVIFTAYINYFLFLLLFYIAFAVVIFINAYRHNRPGAQFGIWSCGVVAALFLFTIANYFGLIAHYKITELIGYIAFFYLQALILSNIASYKLTRAKEDAEKGLKAKSQFLSTMSHEIRTPLNAVIGIAQLLQKDNENLNAQQKEYIDTLSFSGNNLLAIVNDILDYGKMDANKMGFENLTINVKEIARKVAASLKKQAGDKQVELITEIDDRIPEYVTGDPTRTSQVLMNLVGNAVKFTEKGWVKLKLRKGEESAQACAVEFIIEDTGIGISPAKMSVIFDPFTQADSTTSRSYGGTGLGLAITKNILELQGITLQLESEPGKGSVFSFTQNFALPLPGLQQPPEDEPEKPANENILSGCNVLLVEDNKINVMIATRIMEKWGVQVDVAYNGKEAVEKFDAATHQLILMDLHMPEMDGYEAAMAIRKENAQIPIIALTANVAEDVAEEVKKSGMNSIVTKPFKNIELREVLEKYLG
jgi:signal transduction histidine kinase/CheY-like chemotaxis protein